MQVITIDLETYWSDTHSLSKMNPILYVTHPETEVQSIAIKLNDGPTRVVFGEERIGELLTSIDWSDTMLVGHNNSEFDAMLLAWRFGVKPKVWACTLAMAKPHYNLTVGGSLKALAKEVGLGEKGDLGAVNTKGKKLKDFTPDEIAKMRVYNKQDTELCYGLFMHLLPLTPKSEMQIIDMAIRMIVEPKFELDFESLREALQRELDRKRAAIVDVAKAVNDLADGMTEDEAVEFIRPILMSQAQFAGLLERLGAEVPLKLSKTTGKMIPALAKTDIGMTELLEHEDPRVQVAAAGRLGIKSSQLETRIQTFMDVAAVCGGMLPMPLRYCGATTWRFSGTMKMNVQNMNRVDKKNPRPGDALRLALKAPKGHAVVVVDSSNIELRVTHALAMQQHTLEILRAGGDLYCDFASALFGRNITKEDFMERFIGKTGHLGLQFGASHEAFQRMVRYLSSQIGRPMVLDGKESKRIVDLWRAMNTGISDYKEGLWGRCDKALHAMFAGQTIQIDPAGLCYTAKNRIITPGGRFLDYPDLRRVNGANGKAEWRYGHGRNESRIYPAMLLENLCLSGKIDVLTNGGWRQLVDVRSDDLLWDGESWVAHDGVVFKGTKKTISFGGAYMTPDHKVLTDGVWEEAQYANYEKATSSFQRHNRTSEGYVRSSKVLGLGREELYMGTKMRLREHEANERVGVQKQGNVVVRMQYEEPTFCGTNETRNVGTSCVLGLALYVRQVQASYASGMEKLRRAWYYCVREMGAWVRGVLGRHGSWIFCGAYVRQDRQQRDLLARELSVGEPQRTSEEQKKLDVYRYSARRDSFMESSSRIRDKREHTNAPESERVGSGEDVRFAGREVESSREEPTFDLMNAGPLNRFTVRGEDGRAFIVHNCQHLARNIVMEQTLVLKKDLPIVSSTHDESGMIVPEEQAPEVTEYAVKVFSTPPKWWPDIPLAAEAGWGHTYGAAK